MLQFGFSLLLLAKPAWCRSGGAQIHAGNRNHAHHGGEVVSAAVSGDGTIENQVAVESFCNATKVAACKNVSLAGLSSEPERLAECRKHYVEEPGQGKKFLCWLLSDEGTAHNSPRNRRLTMGSGLRSHTRNGLPSSIR